MNLKGELNGSPFLFRKLSALRYINLTGEIRKVMKIAVAIRAALQTITPEDAAGWFEC